VVKVQLDLVGRRRDGLSTRVLHLLNEVLVGLLGEAAALLRVQVDVVDVDRGSGQGLRRRGSRDTNSRLEVLAVLPRLEVDVNAHLVVLERNQGNRYTRVAAEPELEGDVQRLGGRALARHARDRRLRARARRIEGNAGRALDEYEVVGVADHRVQHLDVSGLRRQLRPDLHPVTILAVNALAADLNLNLLQQAVADVVQPAEAARRRGAERAGRGRQVNGREHNLDVRLVHQVSVAVNDGSYALVKVGLAVEGNLNRLYGEVRVALVQNLPERNLGVARDVNILSSV